MAEMNSEATIPVQDQLPGYKQEGGSGGNATNAEDGEKAPSSASQNKTREDYEKAEKLNSALNLKKLSDN